MIWDTPDAQYHYKGKLMVDSETFSAWARPGTEKIMDPKNRDLVFHGGGLRGDHWVNRMIEREEKELIKGVQNIVNGGK